MFALRHKKPPEYADPITRESLDELQQRLDHTTSMIDVLGEAQSRSFQQRVRGSKDDGEHNRDMDMLTARVQGLEKERGELAARLERVAEGLGASALYDTTGDGR